MNRKERRGEKSKVRKAGAVPPAYAEAVRRYQAGRLGDAQHYLRMALEENPRHADSLHLLGVIALVARHYKDAANMIAQAIALKPGEAFYHNNLGLALQGAGNPGAAVAQFERALALKPDFAAARETLGALYFELGRYSESEALFRKALADAPKSAQAHANLANAVYKTGDEAAAVALYEKALELDPAHPLARHNLGRVLYMRGDMQAAETHLRRYLALDPDDRYGAKLLLAAAADEALPERASEAYMRHLYAQRAAGWDANSTYYAHGLTVKALEKHAGDGRLDILDAGCGTGLIAPLLRARAARLDGVDLSKEMLALAKAKGQYDALHEGDLVAFLRSAPADYDAVVSAATLIHFGDLKPVLEAAAVALRENGLLACTLFPAAEDGKVTPAVFDNLAQGGCFAHGRGYIRKTAEACGFKVEALDDAVHELSGEKPLPGLVAVLRRAAGG